MSIYVEPVLFERADAQVVLTLAENAGMPLPEYMEEVLCIGRLCAELYVNNRALGLDTSTYIETPDGSFEEQPLSFAPTSYDALEGPIKPVAIEGITLDLLSDVRPIMLEFPAEVQEFLVPILPQLEATGASFMETALDLRWKLSIAQHLGGRMLVDDGPNEAMEIGFAL